MKKQLAILLAASALVACNARTAPQSAVPQRLNQFSANNDGNGRKPGVPVSQDKTLEILVYVNVPEDNGGTRVILSPYAYVRRQMETFFKQSRIFEDGDVKKAGFSSFSYTEQGRNGVAIRCMLTGVKDANMFQNQVYPNLVAYLANQYNQDNVRQFALNAHYLTDKTGNTGNKPGKILTGSDF